MFENYKLEIVAKTPGYVNEHGHWVEGEVGVVETLPCDIQPLTNELAFRQFGYEGDVEYKVYCPISENIKLQGTVRVFDKSYRVEVCKEWDDYMILVLGGALPHGS